MGFKKLRKQTTREAEKLILDRQRQYCSCHMNSDSCGVHRLNGSWDETDGGYGVHYEAWTKAAYATGYVAALEAAGWDDVSYELHVAAENWAQNMCKA